MTQDLRVPNQLANEKSPYLLQHAHNLVDWYPWGGEAFVRAVTEDKPIFLSLVSRRSWYLTYEFKP